jgi:hypothetical protein
VSDAELKTLNADVKKLMARVEASAPLTEDHSAEAILKSREG